MLKKNKSNTSASDVGRKRKNDIIFIVLLLVVISVSALVMLLMRSEGDTVIVTVDGKTIGEYPLSENREEKIKNGDGYNILVIKDGKADVTEASCPDGICSAHRPIQHDGESIICLPNKVVVEVRTQDKNQPDIIT
ncbi:MAG: NusG domain II-containing protein [Ruminococcus sp.]|nr:NusG domain II-containing protein [Ruminococcus sp.]